MSEADILIGHNIDKFDIKKLNTRFLFHGLEPIGKKQTIESEVPTAITKQEQINIKRSTKIHSVEDFKKLPIIDKKSYIKKFELKDLALAGKVSSAYVIETSSGYSGKPFYWLRIPKEDELFPAYINYGFIQMYGIDKIKTLVIMTLGLGTWTAGEKMGQALRIAAAKNPLLTVVTPGSDLGETIQIIQNLGGYFDQIIINGYPPFVKTVIDEGTIQFEGAFPEDNFVEKVLEAYKKA